MTDAAKERKADTATGSGERQSRRQAGASEACAGDFSSAARGIESGEPLAGKSSVAIMQPYFFPYLGYFQLMRSVETFVVYDDVQFIKGGWINRNNVLVKGERHRITLEINGHRSHEIREIYVGSNRPRLLKTLREAYARAPYASDALTILTPFFDSSEENLASYLTSALEGIAHYLRLPCAIRVSSRISKDADLRGQERVLAVCRALGARTYVNAPGGRALYSHDAFAERGIELLFLEPRLPPYRQFGGEFVSGLSIIDVMMFNPPERVREMLLECELRE